MPVFCALPMTGKVKLIGSDFVLLAMEKMVSLHIEKLPEGFYLATSDAIQGLVAHGRTIAETIEIAKDVAKKLIEAQEGKISDLKAFEESFDYPLVVGV
jgi:predicted RNase H-like HicB family nuclease